MAGGAVTGEDVGAESTIDGGLSYHPESPMCLVSIGTVSDSLPLSISSNKRMTITTPKIPPTIVGVFMPNNPSEGAASTVTITVAVSELLLSSITVSVTLYFPGLSKSIVKVSPDPSQVAPSVWESSHS